MNNPPGTWLPPSPEDPREVAQQVEAMLLRLGRGLDHLHVAEHGTTRHQDVTDAVACFKRCVDVLLTDLNQLIPPSGVSLTTLAARNGSSPDQPV